MNAFATTSAYPMISVSEAWGLIAERTCPLPPTTLSLTQLAAAAGLGGGYVLAEDVLASEDMPPFAASSMDGYAVVAADTSTERQVLGEQEAGQPLDAIVRPGAALRIMTGAPLPAGADAVIPVEDTSENVGRVRLHRSVRAGENVRPVGQDINAGDQVLTAGTPLGAAEVGLLATVGRDQVRVRPRPRVALLATGSELVWPGDTPGPGQIRDSNSFALRAAVAAAGGVARRAERVGDDEGALRDALLRGLGDADLVLTSGGVSMGTRDLIKPLLEELGQVHFGRVAQKPGKPLTYATVREVPVFGLPGFPVSSLVSFENLVRPALRIMAGHTTLWRPEVRAHLSHPLRHSPDRTEFQRAFAAAVEAGYRASTTGSQVSSRLKSLVGANALLVIPQGVGDLPEGAVVRALLTAQPEVAEGGWDVE